MLEQIKSKLNEESTQRAILQVVGATTVFLTSYTINKMLNGAVNAGIDKLMEKLHPVEIPAE